MTMAAGGRRTVPEDFHALYDAGVRAERGTTVQEVAPSPTEGHTRLADDVGELSVDYDEATGLPCRISRTAPAARLTESAPGSPEGAVVDFVTEHRDLWRLSPADASGIEVVSVSRRGLPTVQLVQRADGLEVFNSEVTAAVSPANEVFSVAGQFFPGAVSAQESRRGPAATSAEEAIAVAALDLTGRDYSAAEFVAEPERDDQGPYRRYRFEPADTDPARAFDRPVRVKDVLFPLGSDQFAPGYYLELWVTGFPAFSYVIDAVDRPDVLFRKNLSAEVAFRYRVFNTGDRLFRPEDGPAPGTPHPTGKPDGFQAPTIRERLVEIESLLPGDPWLPDGATDTTGNNCIAYADLQAPQGFSTGDVRGRTTSPRTFDHTYDHGKPASDPSNLQSSLVGMFFHVNWLHDRWYEAGFDEAAGNAQEDNFGRGGIGGDPILAEGLDFSGTDNANMATPADGASPRMQMFEFEGMSPALPSRTSNFDALITFHEMGHYITNRLVGNANGLTNVQGRAMGEGWGDFFAICMTSQDGDDIADGVFAVGGWTDLTPTFDDNYYFSIRRYPYTADLTKNPLTFRHIGNSVTLPPGVPRNPNGGGPNNEVHNAGEVWCATLWEVFANLVAEHGHAEGEQRMLRYVVGGLKLTPNRPTFTQARDGILSAVSVLGPEDLDRVRAGFVKRGLGRDAVSPPSTSTSLAGVVEDFAPWTERVQP
jgi:extracellular elastinolytic metalloproteinase